MTAKVNSGAPPLLQILGMSRCCFPACLGLPAGSFAAHLRVQAGGFHLDEQAGWAAQSL